MQDPFVGDAGFPLIHDRGVNGVLEQIRIHNSNVPDHPGRYAEVDTDDFAFRVRPVCTENLIRVDEVRESPKLAE